VPPFDAVISNFAVLNLIRDLSPVIRHFASAVRPGGLLLLAVQNPWFSGDIMTPAFWRAWAGVARHGVLRYESGATGETWRHLPIQIRRVARPAFRPVRVPSPRAVGCRRSFGAVGVFRLLAFERV
jgi:SAM-dependent methyltransferase